MEPMGRILMIDDDPSIMEMIKMSLEAEGFYVESEANPVNGLEHLKTNQYDLILLDYFMPEMTGDEFVNQLRIAGDNTVILLQTGYAEEDHPIDLLKSMDIQGYFDKTKGVDELIMLVISMVKTIQKVKE